LGDFKLLHYLFLLFPTNIPYMSTWTVHSPNKNRNIIYILILSSNDKTIFASYKYTVYVNMDGTLS